MTETEGNGSVQPGSREIVKMCYLVDDARAAAADWAIPDPMNPAPTTPTVDTLIDHSFVRGLRASPYQSVALPTIGGPQTAAADRPPTILGDLTVFFMVV